MCGVDVILLLGLGMGAEWIGEGWVGVEVFTAHGLVTGLTMKEWPLTPQIE